MMIIKCVDTLSLYSMIFAFLIFWSSLFGYYHPVFKFEPLFIILDLFEHMQFIWFRLVRSYSADKQTTILMMLIYKSCLRMDKVKYLARLKLGLWLHVWNIFRTCWDIFGIFIRLKLAWVYCPTLWPCKSTCCFTASI